MTERYAHLHSKSLMDAANTAAAMTKGASAAAATGVAPTAVEQGATTQA